MTDYQTAEMSRHLKSLMEIVRLDPVFAVTQSNVRLVNHVECQLRNLVAGHFRGRSGESSTNLVGCCESDTLRAVVRATGRWMPNVIPIYVNYSNKTQTQVAPSTLLAEGLRSRGVGVADPPSVGDCLEMLELSGMYVLFVADGFDGLMYQSSKLPPAVRVRILWQFAELGSQYGGRAVIMIRGRGDGQGARQLDVPDLASGKYYRVRV